MYVSGRIKGSNRNPEEDTSLPFNEAYMKRSHKEISTDSKTVSCINN